MSSGIINLCLSDDENSMELSPSPSQDKDISLINHPTEIERDPLVLGSIVSVPAPPKNRPPPPSGPAPKNGKIINPSKFIQKYAKQNAKTEVRVFVCFLMFTMLPIFCFF